MNKLFRTYERKIKKAELDDEIKGLMINISQDCSSYKLDWDEFMVLRKMLIARGKQVKNRWILQCF